MPTNESAANHRTVPRNVRFSEHSFWEMIKRSARRLGGKTLVMGFALYNAFKDEKTPKWAKTVIGGALAYLILPVDAIPDILPVVGFTDDVGALAAATVMVAAHITKEHKDKAARQVEDLFSRTKRNK